MSSKVQIILSLGQSLSVGSTSQPTVLSSQPRFPEQALALDFGNARMLANGWATAAVKEESFTGFAPIVEFRTETHVSGMINQLIQNFVQAGEAPPVFVHINAGFGGASIIQLMLSQGDIYTSLDEGLNGTVNGNVFAVLRDDGMYDSYYRTETSSVFMKVVSGPFNVFENVKTQIHLAVDHAKSLGYEVEDSIVFNWIQGQSDSSEYYSDLLSELIRKIDSVTDSALGLDASLLGVVSQVRGYGGKLTSFEQLDVINADQRIGLGATEFQYQASHPSRAGGDYTHLSAEGYFLMGHDIGNKLFDLMTGSENKPILIDQIEYISPSQIRVHFSGVETKIVADPVIYDHDNLIRAPLNLGFSIGQAEGEIRPVFQIKEAIISGDRHIDILFDSDIDRDFVLLLGSNRENLGDQFGVNLTNFGGNIIRDAREISVLPPTSGANLSRSAVYEYAPTQKVSIDASELLPPLSRIGPMIDGDYIFGSDANDNLFGTEYNDFISGVPSSSNSLGFGTVDTLTGGGGSDLFVLGDARGNFYNRNLDTSYGMNDHARIMDFSLGDRIQVAPGAYFFRPIGTAANPGTALWFDRDANGQLSLVDELIANIWGPKRASFADLVIFSDEAPDPGPPQEPMPSGPSFILGSDASDTLVGTSSDEVFIGVPVDSITRGRGTVDRMTGGGGNDLFVVGDENGNFYSLNRDDNWGTMDHALITDFSLGDRIQVAPGNYLFGRPTSTIPFWSVWLDRDNDGRGTVVDELVARVGGSHVPTLNDLVIAGSGSGSGLGGALDQDVIAYSLPAAIEAFGALLPSQEPQLFAQSPSASGAEWANGAFGEKAACLHLAGFIDIFIA